MRPSPLSAAVAAAALLALAACHDRDEGTSMSITADNGATLASANGSTGEVKLDLPGFQGSLKLPKMQIKANDFDLNGVHLYPGSTIQGINIESSDRKDNGTETKDGRVRVAFTSPAAPATVRDWLLPRLNDGAKFSVRAEGDGLVGTTDEGKPFRLDLAPDGASRAKGTIVMGS